VIFEYISSLLGTAQSFSVLLIERAVVGLLRLCLVVSEVVGQHLGVHTNSKPSLRDQLYIALDVLRSLPLTVLSAVSEQLMAGIAKILEKDTEVVKSQTEWGLIIALFRATVNHPEASKVTLGIVRRMVSEQIPPITLDNWAGVVALLDEFATGAGAATAGRSQRKTTQQASLYVAVVSFLHRLTKVVALRSSVVYPPSTQYTISASSSPHSRPRTLSATPGTPSVYPRSSYCQSIVLITRGRSDSEPFRTCSGSFSRPISSMYTATRTPCLRYSIGCYSQSWTSWPNRNWTPGWARQGSARQRSYARCSYSLWSGCLKAMGSTPCLSRS
jgi:hypothetical protein